MTYHHTPASKKKLRFPKKFSFQKNVELSKINLSLLKKVRGLPKQKAEFFFLKKPAFSQKRIYFSKKEKLSLLKILSFIKKIS